MLYVVLFEDNANLGTDVRRQHMPAHLSFLEKNAARETFFVNIASLARIVAIDARDRPKYRRSMRFRRRGRTGWTSTQPRVAYCAPAMPAHCSQLTQRRVACSGKFP